MQTSILFGFTSAFILLEEKDENVLAVLRITPISTGFFLVCRMLFGTVFSFLGACFVLNFSGIAPIRFVDSLLPALQYALLAPIISLSVACFAKNKIEGMAYFKGIDLLLILPVLSFFVPETFRYIFAIIPVFWTFQLQAELLLQENILFTIIIGFLYYAIVIWFLAYLFKKMVFDK